MARDPLLVLQAIRQRAVEQARQALAVCVGAEAAAEKRIMALDAAVRRDHAQNENWAEAYRFVEMGAARLQAARAERAALTTELAAAVSRSAEARGVVAAARAAAEAVEQLRAEREEVRQADLLRREQHVLDDITRSRHIGRTLAARTATSGGSK